MHSECSDEQAADEPHRPRAAADSNGAVLTPEVDDLRHVGRDGDRDSGSAKDCKHGLRLSVYSENPIRNVKSGDRVALGWSRGAELVLGGSGLRRVHDDDGTACVVRALLADGAEQESREAAMSA